ncbi:MAG: hypothetical protein DMF50_05775 [Acidobacteria bacterium]|nr:MAG: hypothetical protein DMF50_05775 [Acidobacteriota bacterium]
MGGLLEGPLLAIVAVSLLAGTVAVALAILAVGTLRRAIRRLAAQLVELRRHPLVGDVPSESEPALRSLAVEINHLLGDLRARHRQVATHSSGLEALADGPPDLALIGTDPSFRVASFGRGAVNLTGWEPMEILDRHVEILFAPGEWEKVLPKLARRSLMRAGIVERVTLQRRDGGTFPAQLSVGTPAGLEERDAAGLLIAARDLSEERALEHRLRESEERHRRLVEGIQDGVFIVQEERIVYANPALGRLLGRETEPLEGVPFRDLVDARDLLRVVEVLRRGERGEEASGEIACLLAVRTGSPREARIAWATIEYRGRRAVIGTVADVTARALFERRVAASEARLQATLESTSDGILVLEPSARGSQVTLANRTFGLLFGFAPDTLLGQGEVEVFRAMQTRCAAPDALDAFLGRARSGDLARLEGLELSSPRRAMLEIQAGPVRDASGETLGLILTARDVTARVDGERELRARMDELAKAKADLEIAYRELADAQKALAQRNQQLEALNAELKSLDEMKSNLLANVSHELHTPLVSIKGYTEMVLKRKLGPLTPEQERGLGVALKNIDRLIEMIDNLLSFSRMEKGETQLNLEDAPVWQLIDEAVELVGERIKRKNISVTTQYESDDLVVRADRGKIVQVLSNLLTNAVKFNRDGGRITVTARKGQRGFAEIDVADTGIGIPPEAHEKIFERFYQVDSSPGRKYEGTGIGLSIVRDILRLHGCSIRVASEPGQGSVFTFSLPLARSHEVTTTRPPAGRNRSREGNS